MKLNYFAVIAIFAMTLTSCLKGGEPYGPDPEPVDTGKSVYLVNTTNMDATSGTLTHNLSVLEGESVTTCAFFAANARDLGKEVSDAIIHGGKMYIVVNGTNTIEVVNRHNLHSLAKIEAKAPYTGFKKIVGYNGKVYVTSSNGYVCQIDTATYAVEKTLEIGNGPKDICSSTGTLYVSNLGGSISVIDIDSFTETKRISVKQSPEHIKCDNSASNNNIYFICEGEEKPVLCRMNSAFQVEELCNATLFALKDKYLYCYNDKATAAKDKYFIYDTSKDMVREFGISVVGTPSVIGVNDNKIYVASHMDATKPSSLTVYNNRFVAEKTFTVGVNPIAIFFDPEDGL